MITRVVLLVLLVAACTGPTDSPSTSDAATGSGEPDAPIGIDASTSDARAPILFVHGINGEAANFDALKARLVADGWPAERLFSFTFADPAWGCNVDNAQTIGGWVDTILQQTGAAKLTVISHSMGTLSSRHFIKMLGGMTKVERYITLGGMHHGLSSPCLAMFPGAPCVWRELCESGEFITALDAAPATPGTLHWISIYGTADETVPNASSMLTGAENIAMPGVTHTGLLDDAATYAEVTRVLAYPAP